MRATAAFVLAAATIASAQTYGQNCDEVYNKCIQEYTSKGQSPFFPDCNNRRATCAGSVVQPSQPSTSAPPAYTTTTTTTPSSLPTSYDYSAKCQDVWNKCIQEYTSKGQSPFFPECNSRRAACQFGSSTTAPSYTTTTTTTASTLPTSYDYSAKCQDVWNKCIQEYTSKGQSPFFPECNSRRAACQFGSSTTTVAVGTPEYRTTTTPSATTTPADKCQDVYNKCIQEYTSKGQSPFFPECNSRRAACQGGASPSTTVAVGTPQYRTTTTPVSHPAGSTTVSKPAGTTTGITIPTYTGAAAIHGPAFGLLAAVGAVALL